MMKYSTTLENTVTSTNDSYEITIIKIYSRYLSALSASGDERMLTQLFMAKTNTVVL